MRIAKKLKSPSLIAPVAMGKPSPEIRRPSPASPKSKWSDTEEKLSKPIRNQLQRMSNEELEYLLSTEDNFALDCLLDSMPCINKLQRELDDLQKQNTDLAKFNYAREPEFVKDRLKLREVLDQTNSLRRRIMSKHLTPIIEQLDAFHQQLSGTSVKLEEQCERLAKDFIDGNKSFEDFKSAYLELRTKASQKRMLVDRLAKEKAKLLEGLPKPVATGSPVPAPRRRKRVSFNR